MRADRAQRATALLYIRPPVPRAIRIGSLARTKKCSRVPELANLTALPQLAHLHATRQKPQLVIHQREDAFLACAFSHAPRFVCVHRHGLFAQDCPAGLERSKRHFAMCDDGCNDADQIDIVTLDHAAPIIFDVRDLKFARDFFSMLTMSAGDGDDLRSFAILEPGNLRRAGKACADNSNADCF